MTFSANPVFVCDKCGTGFLVAQPYDIHQFPLWKILSGGESPGICGGHISLKTQPFSRLVQHDRTDMEPALGCL